MTSLQLLSTELPWFAPTVVFILGLCIGSFLNVCIYRMPRGLSIAWPNSFCPHTRTPLHWWENVPVFSFLFLCGQGRVSHQQISWQYPVVELLTACIFLALWQSFPPSIALCYIFLSALFIAGSFIDWQFKIIPDSLTVGGAVAGLIAAVWVPALHGIAGQGINASFQSFGIAFQGLLIGSALVMWMAIAGEIAFKREAMGFGDVKLMGMIGAFLGWQGTVFSLFAGAFIGIFVVAGLMLFELLRGKKENFLGREIPFGPMLCAAAFIYLWIKPSALAYWETFTRALHG